MSRAAAAARRETEGGLLPAPVPTPYDGLSDGATSPAVSLSLRRGNAWHDAVESRVEAGYSAAQILGHYGEDAIGERESALVVGEVKSERALQLVSIHGAQVDDGAEALFA